KDFIFRTREFEQMEVEYFTRPKDAGKAFKEWVKARVNWYKSLGLKVREHEQSKDERAHYSEETVDIEYKFPFGWQEIEGIANRGDFDLNAHQKTSGKDLTYFDEETKERYLPHVIEPSAGIERIMLAILCDAYTEEPASAAEASDGQGKNRVVLKLHPALAPYKAAVFPLLANKPQLVELAREIYNDLRGLNPKSYILNPLNIAWDERGNIGKRYYSQDEIGTPYCITVDFDSLEKKDVTVRDRDTTKQKRISIKELKDYLEEKLT
ncbi:MAG: glycine--tRNA ligase, partial [Patescibacteria group bacterium]